MPSAFHGIAGRQDRFRHHARLQANDVGRLGAAGVSNAGANRSAKDNRQSGEQSYTR
jgi:hypothetical protein